MSPFQHEDSSDLVLTLTKYLIETSGLNEFMALALPRVGQSFGTERLNLVDYFEQTGRFVLTHIEGYPFDSLYSQQRRLREMEVRRALQTTAPFQSEKNPKILCIPAHFKEILEAVVVVETDEPVELTEAKLEACQIISKFLGLFMSSARLEVNQRKLIDMSDLNRARQIQLNFLPNRAPRTSRFEIYGYNSSSNVVGGDYFDFFEHRSDSVQCILADACGHGMAAALIMSNFRGLLQSEIVKHEDFGELFNQLNRMVHFDADLIQYLTGIFLHFQKQDKTLKYLNAGHYEPIVVGDNGSVRTLPGGGPPLGMFKESEYRLGQAELESGDLIVLFTDGLVDIQNTQGHYFGSEGIEAVVSGRNELPLKELTREVMRAARTFAGTNEFDDDITLFMMRVR
ncbi:MAG: serine/threonine-protein phosphatase [Acidobacteriota bacterium]|nr:MAG: serine/threonine-protein phosphatase [Acidobacteriota bacterium]